jgi:glycosyltransferase involved in cell wall biosynthesis
MRIGVDATCCANGRGYGRFTRELLGAMVKAAPEHEFVCFADALAAERLGPGGPNMRVVLVAQGESPVQAASAAGSRGIGDILRFTRAVWREPLDVFLSPSVYTYFPLPPRLRAVVGVHDAIADRFPELTLPSARARLFWRAKVSLALFQARIVLTVSDSAARELVDVLGVAAERIRVVVEAPVPVYRPSDSPREIAAAAARAGLPPGARWFVYVGGFNPHKHVDAIVRAHAAVAREMGADAPHLLLVGGLDEDVFHSALRQIRKEIEDAGTGDLVHWPGFVPDEELRHLHSGALALVLPSQAEGFGLPAVEAAACGAPVIATTSSSLPELLDGGGIFIAPGDDAAIATAFRTLLADEPARRAMGERARERASRLSWDRSARTTLELLREVAQ